VCLQPTAAAAPDEIEAPVFAVLRSRCTQTWIKHDRSESLAPRRPLSYLPLTALKCGAGSNSCAFGTPDELTAIASTLTMSA
jgi:hypothetical protein